MRYALAALLLSGCLSMRPETRMAYPAEQALVGPLKAAWAAAGRDVPRCRELDRIDVVPLAREDVAGECHNQYANACIYAVNRTAFSPVSTLIYVDRDVSHEQHVRLLLHEYAHTLRACAWSESGGTLEALRMGAPESCHIAWPSDHEHCDAELWGSILRDAYGRSLE